MAHIKENEFTEYEFSQDEAIQARGFTDLNIKLIRNLRARAAISKINLIVPGVDDKDYKLQLEFYRGYMAAMDHILQEYDISQQEREQIIETAVQENIWNNPQVDISKLFSSGDSRNPLDPINPITPN